MITRRNWLGSSLRASASLAFAPSLLRALESPDGKLIRRTIPSTGEALPVIGLGRGNDSVDPVAFKEVLQMFVGNGGTVLDTVHDTVGAGEKVALETAGELGVQDKLFWSLRGTVPGGSEALKAYLEAKFERAKTSQIDLIQIHVSADSTHLALLKEWKKEGRLRYIGVQAGFDHQLPQLEEMMRKESIDFVGVRYAIDQRKVEETILPLAQERKIGVLAYFPFGGNITPDGVVASSLFARVGETPLPDWATEFDATSWAQFFLKYLVSHPAVTAVRAGTTKARHMLDNLGGGIGRLPNEAMRARMTKLVDALPAAPQAPSAVAPKAVELSAAILDRYVGEYQAASGFTMTFRRDGAALLVKPGNNPEAKLIAQSETRFADPRGPAMEFATDGQGKVTGLTLIQGAERISLSPK